MLFTTPSQFVVLVLALVAGWFFGLASHPGGRKWRNRYTAEREAHVTTRKDFDARVAQANARTVEVERENERLANAAPVAAPAARPAVSAAAASAGTAYPVVRTVRPSRGWFDWY